MLKKLFPTKHKHIKIGTIGIAAVVLIVLNSFAMAQYTDTSVDLDIGVAGYGTINETCGGLINIVNQVDFGPLKPVTGAPQGYYYGMGSCGFEFTWNNPDAPFDILIGKTYAGELSSQAAVGPDDFDIDDIDNAGADYVINTDGNNADNDEELAYNIGNIAVRPPDPLPAGLTVQSETYINPDPPNDLLTAYYDDSTKFFNLEPTGSHDTVITGTGFTCFGAGVNPAECVFDLFVHANITFATYPGLYQYDSGTYPVDPGDPPPSLFSVTVTITPQP